MGKQMSSKLGQGFVSSCVGPVVDISISTQKHEIHQLQALWVSLGISKNLGLPCIYDSLLLIRPECSFREGMRIQNKLTAKRAFYEELNKEESLIHGIMACNKLEYSKLKAVERQNMTNEIQANSHVETAVGLASALILVKAYANWLLVEVNQICYGGIVRTISLGFTEGISSWKVEALCTFQPLVVPVGRSTLGRLFNVLGATIDAYSGIDELPTYSDYPVSFDQYEEQGSTRIIQKLQFKAMGKKIIKMNDYNSYNETNSTVEQQTSDLRSKISDIYITLNRYISQLEESSAQTTQTESLGLVCILGIGAEIIRTRELEVMSFSNVSSTSAQERLKSSIIGLIELGAKLDELKAEIRKCGIKGSVARDRNISPIHKAP